MGLNTWILCLCLKKTVCRMPAKRMDRWSVQMWKYVLYQWYKSTTAESRYSRNALAILNWPIFFPSPRSLFQWSQRPLWALCIINVILSISEANGLVTSSLSWSLSSADTSAYYYTSQIYPERKLDSETKSVSSVWPGLKCTFICGHYYIGVFKWNVWPEMVNISQFIEYQSFD